MLREIEDLPGPRGLPLLGNSLQVDKSRVHQVMEAWSQQYGPFFRVHLGGRRFLVVADHEASAAVLRDRPDGFRRNSRLDLAARELGLAGGVFFANGDAWRRQRRMVMAGFDPSHVRDYFPALLKVTKRLQGRWLKAAGSGASIDLQQDLMRFTVDAISGLAFGTETNTLESGDDVIQRHLDKIFPALFKRMLALVPYWRYVRLPSDRRLERSVAAVDGAVAGFIAQARERIRLDPSLLVRPRNLLEAMISAAAQSDSGVGDRDIAANMLTMLLAGEDTTANTLAWMIHLLQQNPEALRRAQEEVRSVAGDTASFSPEQMGQLVYVEACAHETMRLRPVAPFLIHEALRDTIIGDIRVPAGTSVWTVLRHDSVDERHFPNAAAFVPERWLPESGQVQGQSAAKRISMPFGAGPRMCPGRYLALLEIKMAIAMLLGAFNIESLTTAAGGQVQELGGPTMAPTALKMRLRAI